MKEGIRKLFKSCGAAACGFARAGAVDDKELDRYSAWLEGGNAAGTEYLERHMPLRAHTDSVLPGAMTVISIAFSYRPEKSRGGNLPVIASYAYGKDYHDVIRKRLEPVVADLKSRMGGEWRICTDTAPLPERYWALKAGIGKRGLNGSVIVPCGGSMVFLAEVLTTVAIEPDAPSESVCDGCGACLRACPTGALRGDGTVDCRRCLSHLTIEHRGEFTEQMRETISKAGKPGFLYGCDICQRICPYSRFSRPTGISEFGPLPGIMEMDAEKVLEMDADCFSATFRGSAIKRAKPAGLQRNARLLLSLI